MYNFTLFLLFLYSPAKNIWEFQTFWIFFFYFREELQAASSPPIKDCNHEALQETTAIYSAIYSSNVCSNIYSKVYDAQMFLALSKKFAEQSFFVLDLVKQDTSLRGCSIPTLHLTGFGQFFWRMIWHNKKSKTQWNTEMPQKTSATVLLFFHSVSPFPRKLGRTILSLSLSYLWFSRRYSIDN